MRRLPGFVAFVVFGLSSGIAASPASLAAPAAAAKNVDVALVLAVDVSASVTDDRFTLQRNGYAAALSSPDVAQAIASGADGAVAITFVEWSGWGHERQVVGWTLIKDANSARSFAGAIAQSPRVFGDSTSLSGAIDFSAKLLHDAPYQSERRVIDVSGDGSNNDGPPVEETRAAALADGVTINGLPILTVEPQLDSYYRDHVVGGPGHFVVVARDTSDFSSAILQKLVAEIAQGGLRRYAMLPAH